MIALSLIIFSIWLACRLFASINEQEVQALLFQVASTQWHYAVLIHQFTGPRESDMMKLHQKPVESDEPGYLVMARGAGYSDKFTCWN